MNTRSDFSMKLKAILHDPIDKPFDIQGHKRRAREYAQALGVRWKTLKVQIGFPPAWRGV